MATEAQRRGLVPTKYFTCEVDGCAYTSEASERTLAAHLRRAHRRSSMGMTLDEFIGEGYISMLSEHVDDYLREHPA